MKTHLSSVLKEYAAAFAKREEPFLFFYPADEDGAALSTGFTRGDFWSLARKAATVLREKGLQKGDSFAGCFSANHPFDLAFRLAAVMTGTVPVTINWQADTEERILYKIALTESRLVLTDSRFPRAYLDGIKARFPEIPIFAVEGLPEREDLLEEEFCASLEPEATRIVVFTSGTTGEPKGVEMPYRAYQVNRLTFEQFLQIGPEDRFALLITNPFHHSNSTAVSDWAMRRPHSHIHLVERYSTGYWRILAEISGRGYHRLVAPTVSRHFDFLENLDRGGRLPISLHKLKTAMANTDFLVGSAPVGPTTVERLRRYSGRPPIVRFGSTETCLQVIGTPLYLSERNRVRAFVRGWEHSVDGEAQPGYYIGRPHPPYTEARIVQAVDPGRCETMKDCALGRPGFLLTRGDNLMSGYVKDPEGSAEVFHGGWYTGLKDICFALKNEEDGELDYYWVSRESTLLIRGGANYAYDQINSELAGFVSGYYCLAMDSFEIAVVGLRVGSEHEDSCCVTVELKDGPALAKLPEMAKTLKEQAGLHVSKGAKPDHIRFAPIPRNFKGAVLVNELAAQYKEWLSQKG